MWMLVGIIVILIIIAVVALGAFINKQGQEEIVFYVEKRTPVRLVAATSEQIKFELDVPFANVGREEGIIMDAYVRPYVCVEQYDGALLRGKVNLKAKPREDDYFEAMLVPPNTHDTLTLKFELTPLKAKDAKAAAAGMPDIDVALYVEERGRTELYRTKKIITLTSADFQSLLTK
ncbi:MAG: hypothetical protein LKF34_04650 [Acidaminococcaceae bacterium]|jgi:hypothetical protein|nr:hypothetical protein [Acidaminococcaceae bacterium]